MCPCPSPRTIFPKNADTCCHIRLCILPHSRRSTYRRRSWRLRFLPVNTYPALLRFDMTGCFQFQFRGFVYFTEPVDVACTEFKRSVAFHFVTAFFLFGNDGQAACRYPDTRDPAFIRVSVFPNQTIHTGSSSLSVKASSVSEYA